MNSVIVKRLFKHAMSLTQLCYKVNTYILCFGSLGNVTKECRRNIRKKSAKIKSKTKEVFKFCSISVIIGANKLYMEK